MIKKELKVKNRLGIHARPASLIAKMAVNYNSEIILIKGKHKADAKNILDILSLIAESGTIITLRVNGIDEIKAASAIEDLFENKFKDAY